MGLVSGNYAGNAMSPKGGWNRTDAMSFLPYIGVGSAFEVLFGLVSRQFWISAQCVIGVLLTFVAMRMYDRKIRKEYAAYGKNR